MAGKSRSFSELSASGNVPSEMTLPRVEKKLRVGNPKRTIRSIPMKKSTWWSFGDIQKDLIQGLVKTNNSAANLGASNPSYNSSMRNHCFSLPTEKPANPFLIKTEIKVNTQGASSIASLLERNSPSEIVSRIVGEQSVSSTVPSRISAGGLSGSGTVSQPPFSSIACNSSTVNPHDEVEQHHLLFTPFGAETSANNLCTEDDDNNSTNSNSLKFRAYQAENWTEKFEELIAFRNHYGHCLVPNSFPDNTGLAQWVKRQRYQFKLKQDGKRSTLSEERIQALEEIGFVWDSHSAIWDERLQELLEYKQVNGDCNVPSRYSENRQLAVWVKRQRRQYKFFVSGEPSSMTEERIRALNGIGFQWDLRKTTKDNEDENDSSE